MFGLFKAYVRAGLGQLNEPLDIVKEDVRDNAIRSRCACLILEALRYIGTFEDSSCLETLAVGISSIECPGVVRVALHTLGGLADSRRRYGNQVKALKKSQPLMKALENTLQLLAVDCDVHVQEAAQFALASIFTLLADKDRSPDYEVNIQEFASGLLSPYFLEEREAADLYIGLRALLLLWMADRDSVKEVLISTSYISRLVDFTCNPRPQCPELQNIAAEVLMHAMEFGDLRNELLEVEGVTELTDLCRCQLRHEPYANLRIKVSATLARLCMHSEEVRKQVFSEFNFFDMAADCLREFKVMRPADHQSKSNLRSVHNEFKQTLRSFLEVLFFLTLHGTFKSELLHIMESTGTSDASVAKTFSEIGEWIVNEKDGFGGFYFSKVFCNLLRSREDRERKRRDPNKPGPHLSDDQLDALEEFYDKLPDHSRPAQNGKFDRGAVEVVEALTDILVQQKIVKHLSQLCLLKNSTLNEVSAASEAIGLFARESKHRGIVVQQGAIPALLDSAKALELGGGIYQQDLGFCRQALAHVCTSINPQLFTYRDILDITPHLLALLEDNYELYQFEGALALTNFTSASAEARNRVFHGKGWRALMDLASGENDLCRAAGLEGLCNMAYCELVQDRFAEGFNAVDLQLLLAFLGETENPRAQSAASGCLAILTSDFRVALRLCLVCNVANIARSIKDEDEMRAKPAVLIRLATVASNLFQAVQIEEPIQVKQPASKTEEPLTITVTDQMKAVSRDICEAFRSVDRSSYGADVVQLIQPMISNDAKTS